jgi:hypothetical protein
MLSGSIQGRLLTIWEYAGEVIAALLIYALLRMWFGPAEMADFARTEHSNEVILTSIVFAACVAVFVAFWQILSTELGAEMRKRSEAAAYSRAFAFPILVSLITLVLLLVLGQSDWAAHCTTVLVIYNLLNFVTMIFNSQGVIRLWQDWDRFRKS